MHRRPIFARFFSEFTRGKSGAGQAVPPGFRADVKNGIANASRGAPRELLVAKNAQTKNVYQWITLEAFIEVNLAADRRDADAIAIVRDAGNDAGKEPPIGCDF